MIFHFEALRSHYGICSLHSLKLVEHWLLGSLSLLIKQLLNEKYFFHSFVPVWILLSHHSWLEQLLLVGRTIDWSSRGRRQVPAGYGSNVRNQSVLDVGVVDSSAVGLFSQDLSALRFDGSLERNHLEWVFCSLLQDHLLLLARCCSTSPYGLLASDRHYLCSPDWSSSRSTHYWCCYSSRIGSSWLLLSSSCWGSVCSFGLISMVRCHSNSELLFTLEFWHRSFHESRMKYRLLG